MPENDNERKIDPPDNQGGSTVAVASIDDDDMNTDAAPIDPPDNQGGGNA